MFEGRKPVNHLITGGHYLIALVLEGAIIGAWPTGSTPVA